MAPITRLMYWNESEGGWYDLATDVNVKNMTAPTTQPAAIDEVIDAIEALAESLGWPCIDSDRADDNFSMQFKLGGL